MEVRSRLSDKLNSSPDQNADNSDTPSTDEVEMITEEQPEDRAGVPRPRRQHAVRNMEVGARNKCYVMTCQTGRLLTESTYANLVCYFFALST